MLNSVFIYFFKILEVTQYTIISLIISIIISEFLDQVIYHFIVKNDNILSELLYLFLSIYFLIAGLYFMKKNIPKIPFVFKNISKYFFYIPSFKDENNIGILTGIGWIYYSRQDRFLTILNKLITKYIKLY